ncbi:hypothetical protein [Acetobacter musti]|uniref:hypothetical protein n=1 Tax=Acetobacter musti TaxID=864732 RepID=UPI00156B3442|nr:hypothetical protein [Acetobacter musti]
MPSANRAPDIAYPLLFGTAVFLSVLTAHAFNFFFHEYAHSFMAWGLGWKADPFALDYGTPTIDNILLQQQISENVDYTPIFASGHGWQAALIAAAGPLFANGGTAIACNSLLARTHRPGWLWCLVWTDAFATFNVWSYAPLRTLTTHGDMALLAAGLGISTWLLFPFVTAFALWLVIRFSCHALPVAQDRMFPRTAQRTLSTTVIAVSLGFFSIAGLAPQYGLASVLLSVASLLFLMPVLIAAQDNAPQ